MPATITIQVRDENFSGGVIRETPVGFSRERVTVQDIIESRVRQEVEQYNKKMPGVFQGLVEPSDAEKAINGVKLKPKKVVDAEKQVYVALDAFQKNGFFVMVDNQQCHDLDQEVLLTPRTSISFIKLTPLVGG